MTAGAKKVVVTRVSKPKLVFEADLSKETPGALQFKEDANSRETEVSGGIYVRKAAVPEGMKTARIRVTIEFI